MKQVQDTLPYTGVRNPLTTSSVSHKIAFTYRTAANGWQRKVGAAESMAEAAVSMEALVSSMVHEVDFQPVAFSYPHPDGRNGSNTIDLRITYVTGLRRFIFVRNQSSLSKAQAPAQLFVRGRVSFVQYADICAARYFIEMSWILSPSAEKHLRRTSVDWHVDETYTRVGGKWPYPSPVWTKRFIDTPSHAPSSYKN